MDKPGGLAVLIGKAKEGVDSKSDASESGGDDLMDMAKALAPKLIAALKSEDEGAVSDCLYKGLKAAAASDD